MKKIITYLILALILSMSSLSQINEFKVLPSDGNTKDLFGSSVAISENYAIVGAPYSNDSTGAAYVFVREGSNWIEEQKLIASDGSKGDRFGEPLSTVAISGNYAVIGAPYADSLKGSAYIFRRDGTIWIEEQKLVASDRKNNDQFGISVSIYGNMAVVGAPNDDSTGSVYVFVREDSNWIEKNKIESDISDLSPWFGMAVSLYGDHMVVGAPHYAGSAFIYRRDGNDWIREQRLEPVGIDTTFNLFGISVSISENYILVGAPWSYTNGYYSGAAYVFRKENTSWIYEQKILPSDGATQDWFGLSVSISNGYVIVGAHYNDDNGSESGSAYIFRQQGTNWIEEQKLTARDADTGDTFGVSVSVSGDYAIVGAHGNDDNGEQSGSAYIYNGFVVGVEDEKAEIPLSFQLKQNYPNPFNPSTRISWQVPVSSHQTLKIYDVLGNEVATLVDAYKSAGTYEVEWDASSLPSGIYFYQLKTEGFIETKKMILIK